MNLTQDVVSAWLADRFGPKRNLAQQYTKLLEEVLELGEAVSGVRGMMPDHLEPEEGWYQNLQDEVADVVICAMGHAVTMGFDLEEAVASKWARRKMGPPKDGET